MLKEQTWRCGMRAFVSMLLIVAVLLSALLAVSPSLHQLLHQDANQPTHECVVTMMQKHQVCGDAPAPLLLGSIASFVTSPHLMPAPILSQVDYSSDGSRAPPVVLL